MKMRKQLAFKHSEESLGEIGTKLEHGLHIGDIVSLYWSGRIVTSVICKNPKGIPFLMGLMGTTLNDILYKHQGKVIVPYNLLTDEILNFIENSVIIEDVNEIEMTVSEIEEKLGYKIKVVS